MSQYTHCRVCGVDLDGDGRSFGTHECCCNRGFCMSHCPSVDESPWRDRWDSRRAGAGEGEDR